LPLVPLVLTAGGGGTTLLASDVPAPLFALLASTDGGGGTTSVAPNIFPIKLLMKVPLPDCDGGGGTTFFAGSCTLPLARRRMSGEMSAEGGGATTDGEGKESFGLRAVERSGAETGGGTTDALVICTGAREISRLTAPGAGGMTFDAKAGLDRDRSRATSGAGATTDGSSEREAKERSRAIRGAGAITLGANAGA
jgi:hypothetical protein